MQKLKQRFEFACGATVETGPSVNFQEACSWAIRPDNAPFRYLDGRVLPHLIHPEGARALWDFEFEADAMLFATRFGGVVRGPVRVSHWRRSHI